MTSRRYFDLRNLLIIFAVGLGLIAPLSAVGAPPPITCDLNGDGVVNTLDVQLATNMALGLAPCTSAVAGAGVCNVVLIQRIVNAALTGSCLTGAAHSVTLNWTASTSTNVTGYNLYRGAVSGGPFTKLTAAPVAATSYLDNTAQAGQTYYYVATAVDSSNNESLYSASVSAVVPSP